MKKLLIIPFLLLGLFAKSQTYYVDPVSGDNGDDGLSEVNAWATLNYAGANTSSGDTIFVMDGTHYVTTAVDIAVGVNMTGNDSSTVIIDCNVSGIFTQAFSLYSASEGTEGNQFISNITFRGNYVGDSSGTWRAIYVVARSNVEIYNCRFENFFASGVVFNGKVLEYNPDVRPTTRATGNKFYNNTMINCAMFAYGGSGRGSLQYGSQRGIEIYNNYIEILDRPEGYNGYPIKYFNGGYSQGEKVHHNSLYKEDVNDVAENWNFAIELWNWSGGTEIYENYIRGGIDIGGSSDTVSLWIADYDFLGDIHHNTFGYSSPSTQNITGHSAAMFLENGVPGPLLFHHNYVNNICVPIGYTILHDTSYFYDHFFYYNIFNNIGTGASSPDAPARLMTNARLLSYAGSYNNIQIINNVIVAGTYALNGMDLPNYSKVVNVTVSNNIITGFTNYPIMSSIDGTEIMDTVNIENNIFYNNGTNAPYHAGSTPTHYTYQNNLTSNPQFVVDDTLFHIGSSSPAIDNGKDLNESFLLYDYDSAAIPYGITDIGVYEYGAPPYSGGEVSDTLADTTLAITITNSQYIVDTISLSGITTNGVKITIINTDATDSVFIDTLSVIWDTTTIDVCEDVTIILSATTVACTDTTAPNGSINLTVSGGENPYTYLWSNSATTQDLVSLAGGTYSVTVTDNNGCFETGSWDVINNLNEGTIIINIQNIYIKNISVNHYIKDL